MNKRFKMSAVAGALASGLLVAGCGGGDANLAPKTVTLDLSATPSSLPLNTDGEGPSIGGQYTTTIDVEVRNAPGAQIGCRLTDASVGVAALFYLDGDDLVDGEDHDEDNGDEGDNDAENGGSDPEFSAYRSITLDQNAGGASFHLHVTATSEEQLQHTDQAKVRCTVQDPHRDFNDEVSDTVSVQIGDDAGTASLAAAPADDRLRLQPQDANVLVRAGQDGAGQLEIEAELVDASGHPVTDPEDGQHNLLARIVPADSAAEAGAELDARGRAGDLVPLATAGGVASFTVTSGEQAGPLLIEVLADDANGIVDDGLAEPMRAVLTVPVVDSLQADAPARIATAVLRDATQGVAYSAPLEAQGGEAPYAWALDAGSELPAGLTLDASGAISGVAEQAGEFEFDVVVTDAGGGEHRSTAKLNVASATAEDLRLQVEQLPGGTAGACDPGTAQTLDGSTPRVVDAAGNLSSDPAAGAVIDSGVVTLDAASCTEGTHFGALTVEDDRGTRVTEFLGFTINP